MHQLLDQYLCEKYPKLFAERNLPMSVTCMCWGFDCGNGWFSLIDGLCSQIQSYLDRRERDEKAITKGELEQVVVHQVKEKFSGLRFDHSGGDRYTDGMVDLAESLSMRICEQCGSMDHNVVSTTKGYLATRCRAHLKNPENFPAGNPKLRQIWEEVLSDEKSTKA